MQNDSTTTAPKKAIVLGNPRHLTGDSRRKRAEHLAATDGWACHYCQRSLNSCEQLRCIHSAEMLFGHGMITYSRFREMMHGLDADPSRSPTLDHKTPQSKGGTHEVSNLVLCCPSCNSQKGFSCTYEVFLAKKQQEAA